MAGKRERRELTKKKRKGKPAVKALLGKPQKRKCREGGGGRKGGRNKKRYIGRDLKKI